LVEKLATPLTAVGTYRAHYATLVYPQKLTLTSLTSGGCSVGIVRPWTKTTELLLLLLFIIIISSLLLMCIPGAGASVSIFHCPEIASAFDFTPVMFKY
jgi:hypothetical protein